MSSVPIFINCRDRVSDLQVMVSWLEQTGQENITLLDNDSTYEPLLAYYEQTPHAVHRFGRNVGSRSLWDAGMVPQDQSFIYTDPDVVPTNDCPSDLVEHLAELLRTHLDVSKVGVGFYLDDLTDMFSLEWERELMSATRAVTGGYKSPIDTTFALYRPGAHFSYEAVRTGTPYLFRHTTWYMKPPYDDEHAYYLAHAVGGSTGSSWKDWA